MTDSFSRFCFKESNQYSQCSTSKMSNFKFLLTGANRKINQTFPRICHCSSRKNTERELFHLFQLFKFSPNLENDSFVRTRLIINRAYTARNSHCCFFSSGEEIFWHQMKVGKASLETLGIHELVLPWRDGLRNPTHLPEKGNISRNLIQI